VGTPRSSFFINFSQSPSKLPFDIISKRSPGLASVERYSAMASEAGKARASRPNSRTLASHRFWIQRFSSPSCCAPKTRRREPPDPQAPRPSVASPETLYGRIEFERGSRIAHSRRFGQRPPRCLDCRAHRRRVIAQNRPLPRSPRTHPSHPFDASRCGNVASALPMDSALIPLPCATAIAAVAFNTLCRPVAAKLNSPNSLPRCEKAESG